MHERVLIEELLQENILETAQSYKRFIFKNTLFHVRNHTRLKKRNNSTIQLTDRSLVSICNTYVVTTSASLTSKFIVCGKKFEVFENETLWKYSNTSTKTYSYIVQLTDNISCFLPEMIKTKCVEIVYKENKQFIMPLINSLETD